MIITIIINYYIIIILFYIIFIDIYIYIYIYIYTRGAAPPYARFARQPSFSPEVVIPRIVIPHPLYLLPQEGYTILRALLYSSLNMISKFYYHLHTTMK